ncbi:DNA polymerase III subunit delta [Scytonema millei]|uniref:DNA polymerase III subunit delta n=1 Tax=Scytonema millei VB511283 TaxID=1245923 RepID=A0A9X5E9N1_9CYAN|nr:DNA polymerase III subunit delta [Scytonema millei]NHC37792.1 DNA polymerase III subunit delta [Scytonema millei VB511283]
MPIYFYWGEDEFSLQQAVNDLRDRVLDPNWMSFNYTQIPPTQPDAVIQGLNQAMTPPFGMGSRLVWLVDTTICQNCSDDLLAELKRTLPAIPETSVLLLTSRNKPDGRLKSTKLFQEHAKVQEFALIPPWKTDLLLQQVRQAAQSLGVKLTPSAVEAIVESVGNDTRLLYNELEKLKLYAGENSPPIGENVVADLVKVNTQNSLKLAEAIRQGDTNKTLILIGQLIGRNEPVLKIVATLIGQFRTWLWVKLMLERGENSEQQIAQAAEISNPKRVFILKREVMQISTQQLIAALPVLLELEVSLKQGAEQITTLQTKAIALCQIFSSSNS